MIIKFYRLNLYKIDYDERNIIKPKIKIEINKISENNYKDVAKIRNIHTARSFKKMLKQNCLGIYASLNGEIVGYGWLKQNADDTFYKIKGNVLYLSTFFVSEKYRGNNIYPELINQLINKQYGINKDNKKFYISAYNSNKASLKGIEKTGGKYIGQHRFLRICKITLNKYKIKDD